MDATKKDARAEVEAHVEQLMKMLYANPNGGDTVKEVADLLATYPPEVVRLFTHVAHMSQSVLDRHRSNVDIAQRRSVKQKRRSANRSSQRSSARS